MAKTKALTQIETRAREQMLARAVDEHGTRLLSMIGTRLRDQVEAEDVLQEVFTEFMQSYDLGVVVESLGGWLVRVAQNKVLDRFRRRKTENNYRTATLAESDGEPDGGERPDDEWARAWLRNEIIEALELLPEDQREIFILQELEGKSFADISNATGIPVNTLLSRKHAAMVFLREHLKEVYDGIE